MPLDIIQEPIRTIKQANAIVGGLSNPSKMPGYGYSLPAANCITGGKLQKVKGSVCYGCYAMKGRYMFGTVQNALHRRLSAVHNHPQWVEAMTFLINKRAKKHPYFRWHDSGDIQSVLHLSRIVAVCELTPDVKHWLPTREYQMVKQYLAENGAFPGNLTVRLSAHMIGGTAPDIRGLPTSTVDGPEGYQCPAPTQGNECSDCRACWEPAVDNVNYHKH